MVPSRSMKTTGKQSRTHFYLVQIPPHVLIGHVHVIQMSLLPTSLWRKVLVVLECAVVADACEPSEMKSDLCPCKMQVIDICLLALLWRCDTTSPVQCHSCSYNTTKIEIVKTHPHPN